ncbi:hypothetical protein J3P77_20395 [Pseudomonas sp. R1-18]|uniref:hypothetical protein n=1 Tax=Pseudomonas sp. R1-18 TaxID=1632772 RepID=UPI003DA963E0
MYPVSNINPAPVRLSKIASTAVLEEASDLASLVKRAESSAPKISTLARQLSECAERAAVRDKTLSREELGTLASRLHDQLSSGRYVGGNIPKMLARSNADDPELLHRDHQAVLYNVNSMFGDKSLQSPFHGLSREDMVLILYDESDTFTINERYAAFLGANQLEQNFRENYCRRNFEGAFNEHPFLGYAEPLMHYRSLPLIEQARYPEDYEARLESWMIEAWAEKPPTDSREFKTLFEILAGVVRDRNHLPVMESEIPEPAKSSTTTEPVKPHGSSSDGGTAHVSS